MSPRSSTLLALMGVLLAGIPLPALTAARREVPAAAEQAPAAPAATRPMYAQLQVSGQPQQLELLCEGRQLAQLSAEELALTPCELELHLPATGMVDIEVLATWAEGEPTAAQAVTLTLEPEGQPAQPCTRWTEPGSSTLHALFNYSW